MDERVSPSTQDLFALDYEVWSALSGSRLSQARVDRVVQALRVIREREEQLRRRVRFLSQENVDLRIHLKDRDRYVAVLEEQLKPYLRDAWQQPAIQEVMPEA